MLRKNNGGRKIPYLTAALAATCLLLCGGVIYAGASQTVVIDEEESETETEIPTMDAVPESGSAYGLIPTAVREAEKKRVETETETDIEEMPVADPFSKDYPGAIPADVPSGESAETEVPGEYAAETAPEEAPSEADEGVSEEETEAEDMKWRKEEFSDLGLTIEVPEMCAVEKAEDPGYRYIYLGRSNEIIPYIILGTWENVDMNIFSEVFGDYMKGHFSDIVVSVEETPVIIDNRQMYRFGYEYTIDGARCRDSRIAWPVGGKRIFLFGSKEIPEMRYTLGDLFMKIVESAVYGDDGAEWEKGTVENGTYRNESFGLETTLPEGWSFETPARITETSSLAKNLSGEEGLPEYSTPDATQYDASAANEDGTLRWNVVLQDFTGYALEDAVSEADIEKLLEEMKERAKGTTEDGLAGYTFVSAETAPVTLCEKTAPGILVHAKCGETDVWQRTVMVMFGETTAAYLTVTTEGADGTMEIIERFHLPEEEEIETETETEKISERLSEAGTDAPVS